MYWSGALRLLPVTTMIVSGKMQCFIAITDHPKRIRCIQNHESSLCWARYVALGKCNHWLI